MIAHGGSGFLCSQSTRCHCWSKVGNINTLSCQFFEQRFWVENIQSFVQRVIIRRFFEKFWSCRRLKQPIQDRFYVPQPKILFIGHFGPNLPKLTFGWGRLASFLVDFEAIKVAVSAKSFIFSDYHKMLIFEFIYSLSWNRIRRINVNGSQKMFLISELRKIFEVFNCFNYFLNSELLSRSERVHQFLTFGTSSKFPVQAQ